MKTIVTAGHICIDLIPDLGNQEAHFAEILKPGSLVHAGALAAWPGGSVANTGLALAKLGADVRLIAKTGDDALADLLLREIAVAEASTQIRRDASCGTSYTIVLTSPHEDRVFLHHPGANDSFGAADVPDEALDGVGILHFGYPPLMLRIRANDGLELCALFEKARHAGVVTSLDLSMPDSGSAAGRVSWPLFFDRVLPLTDIFAPSFDELALMLGVQHAATRESVRALASYALSRGAAIALIKLGEDGLYLKTTDNVERLRPLVDALGIDVDAWRDAELHEGCFESKFVGSTGSGDCTIAGMLDQISRGGTPAEVLQFATAVGACSVECASATGGIKTREAVQQRLAAGWKKLPRQFV